MGGCRTGADCLSRLRDLRPDPMQMLPKGTTFKLNQRSLFKDGFGPALELVGGEFQPPFATVYPGGGAHLFNEGRFYFRTIVP